LFQKGNILDLTSTIKDEAEDDGTTTALLYRSRGIAAETPSTNASSLAIPRLLIVLVSDMTLFIVPLAFTALPVMIPLVTSKISGFR
jgi:hypothetical protein